MARIRVAAVQSGVDPAWTPGEWSNHLRWQLAACREAQAELVVFPAWTGVYQDSFPRGFPEEALGTLIHLLGDLAREAGVYLVPGTIPIRCRDGGVRLRGFLLDPLGSLVGAQDQLLPPPGYAPGLDLAVLPTAFGQMAMLLGADALVPEIGRILALQGADLFCAPAAWPVPHSPWRQDAGLWQIVQANQTAGVEACLVGTFNGQTHAGHSRLLGPVEMTADGHGILSSAGSLTETELVTGVIDLEHLALVRRSFPIFDQFNLDLYRSGLADAYRRLGTAPDPPPLSPVDVTSAREVGGDECE